jgi:hypothetical protein
MSVPIVKPFDLLVECLHLGAHLRHLVMESIDRLFKRRPVRPLGVTVTPFLVAACCDELLSQAFELVRLVGEPCRMEILDRGADVPKPSLGIPMQRIGW